LTNEGGWVFPIVIKTQDVAVALGVKVSVIVNVALGVKVKVGVSVSVGVQVIVGVSVGVSVNQCPQE